MLNMPLACVMWKSTRLKGTLDVGWLMSSICPFILTWGNTKNEETCKELAEEIIRDRGERYIIRYDKEIESIDKGGLRGIIAITDAMLDDILFGEFTTVLHDYPITRKINGN
jgi:hypothetical protein